MTLRKATLTLLSIFMIAVGSSLYAQDAELDSNKININTATAEQLADVLVGVGESKARAIIEHREKHGSFQSLDSLRDVKGVGDIIIEANASVIEI